MFAVILTYLKPLDEVLSYRPAHTDHLKKYYQSGHFIVSGMQSTKDGGFILANASSKEELQKIVDEDPFLIHEIAKSHIIEFETRWYSEQMKPFIQSGNPVAITSQASFSESSLS